ncbi:MAG: hypothetical protein IJY20_06495 [Clostridia bacterium]|nr:hypothetical protein [Clostridia bacterium]
MFFTFFIFLPISLVAFFVDFILAVVISTAVDATLFLPLALVWAVFGTGTITLLLGVLLVARMDIEFSDDILKRLPLRILYSYFSGAALIYGGVQFDKLFSPGFAETEQFIPFLIAAFVVGTVIYLLHWLLTRQICKAIIVRRERKRNAWFEAWAKRPPVAGSRDVHVTTYEEEHDKELEEFNNIVENQ